MNRLTYLLCLLATAAVFFGLSTPVLATPTPEPQCSDLWPVETILTIGKGQSPSNNPKVLHLITGHIIGGKGAFGMTAHRIPVCAGTTVSIEVRDSTGVPTITAGGSLVCNEAGCSGSVNVTEKYKSVSSDGKDTDRITLLPK